jgi:hypothetical protein
LAAAELAGMQDDLIPDRLPFGIEAPAGPGGPSGLQIPLASADAIVLHCTITDA